MRRLVRYVLTLLVIVFYSGVTAAAGNRYYGSVTSFWQNITFNSPVTHSTSSIHATTPITNGPNISSTVPFTGSPALKRQLAAAVQHLSASGNTPPSQRINWLILGSDNDQKFASYAAPLTQVMIVLSIDPVSHTVTLLSIPRDFWVHIPAYGYNTGPDGTVGWSKIDVAAKFGFNSAACTVEYNFGIPIDHWAWVGLDGFIKVINTLSGVTLDVPHPVIDDTYPDDFGPNPYAYRRIYIPPGPQHLDGDAALHFVRSRHGDAQEDFGRSSRQQILLTQLRSTLQSQDLTGIVDLIPALLNDFHDKLRTDVTADFPTALQNLQTLRAAAHYKIIQVVLSPPYSDPGYQAQDNDPQVDASTGNYPTIESAVLPNWQLINPEIQQLFGSQSSARPHCTGVSSTPLANAPIQPAPSVLAATTAQSLIPAPTLISTPIGAAPSYMTPTPLPAAPLSTQPSTLSTPTIGLSPQSALPATPVGTSSQLHTAPAQPVYSTPVGTVLTSGVTTPLETPGPR